MTTTDYLYMEKLINRATSCLSCTCDNSTLHCQFLSCQPQTCPRPIKIEGECCDVCPYNSTPLSIVNKPTEQSSTLNDYTSAKAVDGSSSTILYPSKKCSHTVTGAADPWWRVDLGEVHCISKVTILNRGDCCSDRLENAVVRAGLSSTPTINAACGSPVTASQAAPLGGTVNIECDTPLTARYISVDIPGSATLQLCEVTVEETSMAKCPGSSSDLEDYPSGLPCQDDNHRRSLHGETYKPSDCSSCTCDNSILHCQFFACQPPTCRSPIKIEGECCRVCPYNVIVSGVTPEVASDTAIQQGKRNVMTLDLNVLYTFNRETTSVRGTRLWTAKLWMSSTADGSDVLFGTAMEEALDEGQKAQTLIKSPDGIFRLRDIQYEFDLTDHTCSDAAYICATFNKAPNARVEKDFLEFLFTGVPTEDVLTGCTKIDNCEGGLFWRGKWY